MGSAVIARQAAVHVTRWWKTLKKKTQKVILKIYFANINTAPHFEQKWQKTGRTYLLRNLGNAWQQWLQCIQGGGVGQLLHACILIQVRMHANSETEA